MIYKKLNFGEEYTPLPDEAKQRTTCTNAQHASGVRAADVCIGLLQTASNLTPVVWPHKWTCHTISILPDCRHQDVNEVLVGLGGNIALCQQHLSFPVG